MEFENAVVKQPSQCMSSSALTELNESHFQCRVVHRLTELEGLSLRTQELTAINLFVRLLSSLSIRGQIHVVLDSLSLVATLWVMYMMWFKLKSTYLQELDNMPLLYLLDKFIPSRSAMDFDYTRYTLHFSSSCCCMLFCFCTVVLLL